MKNVKICYILYVVAGICEPCENCPVHSSQSETKRHINVLKKKIKKFIYVSILNYIIFITLTFSHKQAQD